MGRDVLSRWAPGPDFTVGYGAEQVADVRRPPGDPVGAVLFLHGGFWRDVYDRAHVGPAAVALAAAGFVTITPEYRRTGAPGAPGAPGMPGMPGVPGAEVGGWPGTFDDVAAAVREVPAMVANGLPLVLAGHSAGGQLALWAAAGLARDGRPPRGVLALAPVADLAAAYQLDLDRGAVAALLGGGPVEFPGRYAAADPMALLPLGVPVVLVHGDRDARVPVEISRRYAAAATAAGDQVTLHEWPGVDHFAVIDPESAVWPGIVTAVGRLAAG
jgi:acetyl esterase/lipase